VRVCTACRVSKPESEFWKVRTEGNRLRRRCITCSRAALRDRYRRSPATFRKWSLGKYGLTQAEFDQLLAAQRGRCAICGTDKPGGRGRFSVDHDHVDGWEDLPASERRRHVRGLLCNLCNRGLGSFHDDPQRLVAAAAYVTRPGPPARLC
jgi:hypothetical protein